MCQESAIMKVRVAEVIPSVESHANVGMLWPHTKDVSMVTCAS
jgi:hypothetical protein